MKEEKETDSYILSIEDNPDDFEIISRALRKVAPNRVIRQCQSGDEALKFLRSQHKNAGLPRIILLDLNLPGTDGRDILKMIKNDKDLKFIPVIIFSTSNNEKDIDICYNTGANAYLRKPSTLEGFVDIAQALNRFWFECAFLAIA